MRRVLFLAALFFCLALIPRLAAQDSENPSASIPFGRHGRSSYTIRGNLRDASTNLGAAGIKVDLREAGGATVASAFTGSTGEFNFNEVGSGTYEITVTEVGYQTVDRQISVEDSVFGLQLWLRKASDHPAGSAAATVSVRELSIPRKAHEYMTKGINLLYQKSDYRGSIEQFQRAIREYPGYYEAYGQMAVAYLDLGDQANTEDALKKSIDVSQQHYSEAYFALAGLYVDAQRFGDAETIARRGAELDDASWKGHYELACALFGLDRATEAETEAQTAADRQPQEAETQLLLANIHIQLHNLSAVLADLNTYLKLEPNGAHAELARHLRDQIQTAMQKAQAASDEDVSSSADDSPTEDQAPNSK